MFEKIKRFYDMKLYTKEMVHKFVEKGIISEEQYLEMVGQDGEYGNQSETAEVFLFCRKIKTRRNVYGNNHFSLHQCVSNAYCMYD